MGVRAYKGSYEFYILKKDIPCIKAGAVFYWDKNDNIYGSAMQGCLKLCWTPNGNCYDGLCGDTIIFHANAREDEKWFETCNTSRKENSIVKTMTIEDIEKELGYKINIISK